VCPIGLGCWAIGGPTPVQLQESVDAFGWGPVDDEESIRAIHRALDLGINLFDTANNYGAGHSEKVLGRALKGHREKVVISTKFATVFNEAEHKVYFDRELDINRESLTEAVEGSLRRLGTDYIDIYLLHNGQYDTEKAPLVMDLLEELVREGKIRYYGWSTDDPERARIFAAGEHCTVIEFRQNVIFDNAPMTELCEEHNLACLIKSPLHSGILTGKFNPDSSFPEDDGRRDWNFREGNAQLRLRQVAGLRDVLTGDGRSMAQAALAWILTRNPRAVPIPGFKTVAQVEENFGTLSFDHLTPQQMERAAQVIEQA
jgi:aryl-alcohol dehydrogenase-like predicted oxidoreductase